MPPDHKNRLWKILAAPALLLGAGLSAVQQDTPEASSSSSFNTLHQSARAAALGVAYAGSDDDASSAMVNPATLSRLLTGQTGLHHHSFFGDITQESALIGMPLGKWGGLGLGINYVDYGSVEGRDTLGRKTQIIGASDLGLGISYGAAISHWLDGGFSLRALRQTLASEVYNSYGIDLGLRASAGNWRISASGLNFGTGLGNSTLASLARLGMAWRIGLGEGAVLTPSLGLSARMSGLVRTGAALEMELSDRYFLRVGLESPVPAPELQGLQNFTLGAGLRLQSLDLDYAFKPLGELGASHRVSLVVYFRDKLVQARAPAVKPATLPATASPLPAPPLPKNGPMQARVEADELEAAAAMIEAKQGKEAVLLLSKYLQANPKHAPAWALIGRAYFESQRLDYAEQCFEESLRLDPAQPELKAWLSEFKARPAVP